MQGLCYYKTLRHHELMVLQSRGECSLYSWVVRVLHTSCILHASASFQVLMHLHSAVSQRLAELLAAPQRAAAHRAKTGGLTSLMLEYQAGEGPEARTLRSRPPAG